MFWSPAAFPAANPRPERRKTVSRLYWRNDIYCNDLFFTTWGYLGAELRRDRSSVYPFLLIEIFSG
jgi:hypothetical protein